MIAAVAFVESYTIGTSLAAREHSRLDNSQELLALGTANRHSQSANVRRISVSFGPCSQSCSDAATPALAGVWRGEKAVAQFPGKKLFLRGVDGAAWRLQSRVMQRPNERVHHA